MCAHDLLDDSTLFHFLVYVICEWGVMLVTGGHVIKKLCVCVCAHTRVCKHSHLCICMLSLIYIKRDSRYGSASSVFCQWRRWTIATWGYNQTKRKGDWTDFGACVLLYSVRTRLHVRLASSCMSAHPASEVVMSLLFPLIIYDSGHYRAYYASSWGWVWCTDPGSYAKLFDWPRIWPMAVASLTRESLNILWSWTSACTFPEKGKQGK